MSLWMLVLAVGGVLVAVHFLAPGGLGKLAAAAGGQLGKLVNKIWAGDPVAVRRNEIDRQAAEIGSASLGIIQYGGVVKGLERSLESRRREATTLESLATQYAKEDNDPKALEKLAELERVKSQIAKDEKDLNTGRQTLDGLLKKVKYGTGRIAELRRELGSRAAELDMSRHEAQLAQVNVALGTSMNFDGSSAADAEIDRQIDRNKAAGAFAHEMAREGLEDIEALDRAKTAGAADALAALKTKLKPPSGA